MDSIVTHLIPATVIINGKVYFHTLRPTPNSKNTQNSSRFELSSSFNDTNEQIGLQLKISPTRNSSNDSPTKIKGFQTQLFFPLQGIINYRRAAITTLAEIDRTVQVPTDVDITDLRCLRFDAKEILIETGSLIPKLKTEQMDADLARIINTAKIANAIPNAVMEVYCIFRGTDDSEIESLERNVIDNKEHLGLVRRSDSGTHLTVDSLSTIYRSKQQIKGPQTPTAGDISQPRINPFLNPSPSDYEWRRKSSSIINNTIQKEGKKATLNSGSMFQQNAPPKQWDEGKDKAKVVCFNCYVVGHRVGECTSSRKQKLGKEELGGNTEDREDSPAKLFCDYCNESGHKQGFGPECHGW